MTYIGVALILLALFFDKLLAYWKFDNFIRDNKGIYYLIISIIMFFGVSFFREKLFDFSALFFVFILLMTIESEILYKK